MLYNNKSITINVADTTTGVTQHFFDMSPASSDPPLT